MAIKHRAKYCRCGSWRLKSFATFNTQITSDLFVSCLLSACTFILAARPTHWIAGFYVAAQRVQKLLLHQSNIVTA